MTIDKDLARRLIAAALKRGAEMAEVYQRASTQLSVDVKDGAVDAAENANTYAYGLRVIKDSCPGFSFSNDPTDADRVLDVTFASCAHTNRDEALGLPEMASAPKVETYDRKVLEVSEKKAIEYAAQVEEGAKGFDKRMKKVRKSSASFRSSTIHITNSKGLEHEFSATSCAANIMAVAEDGDEAQLGWGFSVGRALSEVDFTKVGKDAARRAVQMLGAKRISSCKSPILFDSSVSAEFLSVLSSMLSAENIQKGRSLLKGKTGQSVISTSLSVIDNGTLSHGPGRRPFDDEGTPVQENILIKQGVLRGFMYDTLTANKDGVSSTGNAMRGGPQGIPTISSINMFFQAEGAASSPEPIEKLFSSLKTGMYVTEAMGVHTINPVSGDFSVGVSGLWYDKGEPAHAVKEAVISGNILTLFQAVTGIADDMEFFGSIGSPSLLFEPLDISA
jgi:PmbA protein